MAALALQGPTSREVLKTCADANVEALKFFGSIGGKIAGKDVRISRTGYTGDLGYEVWSRWDDALAVWDAVSSAGKAHGLVACGLDALDMARIEAGFVLLGVDYFSSLHVTVKEKKYSPFEIGLDFALELEREPFIGQKALLAERRDGRTQRALVGLEIDWEHLESLYRTHDLPPQLPAGASRESLPVFVSGRQIGRVSSSTWSPTLKKYLALATIAKEHAAEGSVVDIEHTVLFERRAVRAKVVKRPFFDPERKRKP
jgi:aminomethyltransferase